MNRKYFEGASDDSICKRRRLYEETEDEYGDTFDDGFEDDDDDDDYEQDDSKYFEDDDDFDEFDVEPSDEELSKAEDDINFGDFGDDINDFPDNMDLAEIDDINSFAGILDDELRKREADRSIYRIKYTDDTTDTEYRVVPIARLSGSNRKYVFNFLELGKVHSVDISAIDLTDIWIED